MNFTEEFLAKIFVDEDMRKIPCGCQSTAIHSMESILERLVKENEYITISELFSESNNTTSNTRKNSQ